MPGRFAAACLIAVAVFANASAADDANASPLKPPLPGAEAVTATERLVGRYVVGGRVADPKDLGGFCASPNFSKPLGQRAWGTAGALSIVAFPAEAAAKGDDLGFVVRIINRTGSAMKFRACDSELYLVCQAKAARGAWRDIEKLPWSKCGHSYHHIALEKDGVWEFAARKYDGPIAASLRFRLEGTAIVSNQFEGRVTPAQLAATNGSRR